MELVMGVGPMNLVITNDALYQLSYTSAAKRIITKTYKDCKPFFVFFLQKGRAASALPFKGVFPLNTPWPRRWR